MTAFAAEPVPHASAFPYERLLWEVVNLGEARTDRTGVGTRSLFAPTPLRFDLSERRVPLVTSKQVAWRMALREYLWMLSGSTDVNELRKSSASMAAIWDNWADERGNIGPTYGAQYRHAGAQAANTIQDAYWAEGVDQLARVIDLLVTSPDTRRALISLWGVSELDDMGIEPCMVLFQFSLRGPKLDQLDLHIYQRSADMMLGVPFDLFQAGVLTHIVAREVRMRAKRHIYPHLLTWSAGDVHVYHNHIEAAHLQLQQVGSAPKMNARLEMHVPGDVSILDQGLTANHFSVSNYHHAPAIKAGPIAV